MNSRLSRVSIFFIVFVLTISVFLSSAFAFSAGQCTWYAANHFAPGVNWSGNAGDWYANAGRLGWAESSDVYSPVVGSIVVWGGGKIDPDTGRAYGHVAIVESISSNGITVGEANWDKSAEDYGSNDIDHDTLSFDKVKNRGVHNFIGYIYPYKGGSSDQFTYANNAQVSGDFFYVRDASGNIISGRQVSDGDRITVIDVSYSKQLCYVEYPTSNGVRTGYISNTASIIKYYYEDQWVNGSTTETVYDENGNVIGSLSPREKATPLYRKGGKLCVVYDTGKGLNTKSGFVAYNGGFTKF
jgi:surface antigen